MLSRESSKVAKVAVPRRQGAVLTYTKIIIMGRPLGTRRQEELPRLAVALAGRVLVLTAAFSLASRRIKPTGDLLETTNRFTVKYVCNPNAP